MHVLPVPDELIAPPYPYPRQKITTCMEDVCRRFVQTNGIKSDRVYLPIHWTCNYAWQNRRMKERGFRYLEAAQRFINELSHGYQYVTVCRGSDGIYERIPSGLDLLVFGAGGAGDIPLPLVTETLGRLEPANKDLIASFVGSIQCGTQHYPLGEVTASSSNKGGIGTDARELMMREFVNQPKNEFHVQRRAPTGSNGKNEVRLFCDLMNRSKYALAPRGYGRTSFRLYESMQLGCVPVYIYDVPWIPYQDVLDWQEFCVLCPIKELPNLPGRLRGLSSSWYTKACTLIQKLTPEFFSFAGVSKQLKRMIEQLV